MLLQLSICTFIPTQTPIEALQKCLDSDRYTVTDCTSETEFVEFVEQNKQHLDCLIFEENQNTSSLIQQLQQAKLLLPSVILTPSEEREETALVQEECTYHRAEVYLHVDSLERIVEAITRAIDGFLKLSPTSPSNDSISIESVQEAGAESFLMEKQQRLADKLRERLGYLGVYYKRNPQRFLRNLPRGEQTKLLQELQRLYRQIVLNYFSQDATLNQAIDEFVNVAFFADISVTHIVEIHMDLMDEFSKQLKLEGRSEEILLDYRLTLIDTIAHLCEMYRRSIPRES
ncbi:circadian clock protein KaiA [Baaleninema sp.]|uniref:circadian clock protein KaiA n=1 Tax=Baaleninema sp. TaxID=3101197 RepID=UPI003D081A92